MADGEGDGAPSRVGTGLTSPSGQAAAVEAAYGEVIDVVDLLSPAPDEEEAATRRSLIPPSRKTGRPAADEQIPSTSGREEENTERVSVLPLVAPRG